MPAWNREEAPRTLTKPHRRLMHLLSDLGLEVQTEFQVGRYFLDVFCEEVWIGFEADGRRAHSGTKRQARDRTRDEWIFEEAGISVLRLDEQVLRKVVWEETKELVRGFIEKHAEDLEVRKEKGRWTLL